MNIREIAKDAGVSIATVSRVINGKTDVSPETRERILKIIKEKDFKPKTATFSVSDNIGIFLGNSKTEISNPYSSIVLSGIANAIFNRDYILNLIPSLKISKDGTEFFNFCNLRNICGGIFISTSQDDVYIKGLAKYVPIVVVGNDFKDAEEVGSVRSDNFTGAYEATKQLIKMGHKNILLVMADLNFLDHKERYEGAKKALEEAGLEMNSNNIMDSYFFNDTDLQYKLDFIVKNDKPDAIFVAGDQEAIRVMRVLQGMGIKIPEDISIVGYDNLQLAASSNPPLTTVNQPVYDIGREAGRLLLNMVSDKEYKPRKILLQANYLMMRESVKQRA